MQPPLYCNPFTPQLLTAASPPALAPSCLSPAPTHAPPYTPSLFALAAFTRLPGFARLQTWTLVSSPPLAACVPAPFHAMLSTRAVCADHRSVATSQLPPDVDVDVL